MFGNVSVRGNICVICGNVYKCVCRQMCACITCVRSIDCMVRRALNNVAPLRHFLSTFKRPTDADI